MQYDFSKLESKKLANEFDNMLDFINDAINYFYENKYILKESLTH